MSRRINNSEDQLTLPFGQVSGRTISYEDRRSFFWFLISGCLLSLVLYIYAINATAHHISVRQHLVREVQETSTELSSLEFAYIELQNAITMEKATELGFKEVKKPLFVSRESATSLTLNTAR